MYSIKIITSFSAAHFLRNYKGKCENLHGHNWKVEILIVGDTLDSSGMLMDFSKVKSVANEVLADFDHKVLNDLSYFKEHNPSSEEIAKCLFVRLREKVSIKNNCLSEVRVWETDTACASYKE
jgi:6-pyruvoyltetrahydropterin/6-carboxytetrahydropterin synthase